MSTQRISRWRWLIALAVAIALVGAVAYIGVTIRDERQRRADALADLQERRVRELLRDEPLDNMFLTPHFTGLPGLLAHLGFPGPVHRRATDAFMRIDPIPTKGQSKTIGQTIDACRIEPDVQSAQLRLKRKVYVSDPETVLGPYSSRSKGDVGMIKDIDFYQYGNLDLGIKDGVVVVVRVR